MIVTGGTFGAKHFTVFLDGVRQQATVEALDTEHGFLIRLITDDEGKPKSDEHGHVLRETVFGRVTIGLKPDAPHAVRDAYPELWGT